MSKGYTHIYTGNGKGKTTAAFGVVLRSIMIDKKVYVGQFIKGMKYSETKLENTFTNLKIEQYGVECFIDSEPLEDDFKRALLGYNYALNALKSCKFDLIVLDEIFIAYFYKMISKDQIINLIESKCQSTELILTGRYCPKELYEFADLVTEMTEVKHYYSEGVLSREGIDC
ncbi:cob(I)yrinic acid a,c-diamide adenosyltransferase [Helicovermis profundi]|uniref:Cob(I)yrinic acid a,c-diamide adenosyltransferase n=1 Tax=Helicovermis profundi TaxID=3065157 RepID=A0AAU9EXH4_9FIRM|nr:cob(I)yrinic acid a,c-diamide adenosyltransferase [Clostridia bacterium S502]